MPEILAPEGVDTLLTPAQAAELAGVSSATIRQWASRGKIIPRGLGPRGVKMYRWLDVARCEKATRQRSGRAARQLAQLHG